MSKSFSDPFATFVTHSIGASESYLIQTLPATLIQRRMPPECVHMVQHLVTPVIERLRVLASATIEYARRKGTEAQSRDIMLGHLAAFARNLGRSAPDPTTKALAVSLREYVTKLTRTLKAEELPGANDASRR